MKFITINKYYCNPVYYILMPNKDTYIHTSYQLVDPNVNMVKSNHV